MTVVVNHTSIDQNSDGVQTIFLYDFEILDNDDLDVFLDGVVVTTGFVVTGALNPTGGDCTFDTAPATGVVTLSRNTPIDQETDYVKFDPFPSETHEEALDKLTLIAQELEERVAGGEGGGGGDAVAVSIAVSDEATALVVQSPISTFRMPFSMNLERVKASLTTAQVSGTIITVDIKNGGVSVFSTLVTIDNNEKTSFTAIIPSVIDNPTLEDDAEITVDLTVVGDGTATGLKIYLTGLST